MVSHRDFPSDLSQDFAGESLEKVLGSDLRRAPLHWVLPMEILGDTTGFPSMGVPWGTRNGWFIRENRKIHENPTKIWMRWMIYGG
jgi:hypothetical protein